MNLDQARSERSERSERTERTTSREQRTQRHQAILDELIDIGMDLARQIQAQAKETNPGPEAPAPDLHTRTQSFDRVARAVRRTILLARALDEPPKARPPAIDRTAIRKRIIRRVEDALKANATSRDQAEALEREFTERLDSPELEEDLATQPLETILNDIYADLGIGPGAQIFNPWKRRTPADLAILSRKARRPTPTRLTADPPPDG